MAFSNFLVEKKIISSDDVSSFEEAMNSSEEDFAALLKEKGIDPDNFLKAKGEYYDIPIKKVDSKSITRDILDYVPEDSARHYNFVPIGFLDGVLEIGFIDPDNIEARDALNFISSKNNLPFKIYLISQANFNEIIDLYKGLGSEVKKALSEFENTSDEDVEESVQIEETKGHAEDRGANKAETRIIEDAPVTKIVATILRYATEGNASDIHIEHLKESVRVRFRVDGILNTSLVLPKNVQSAVIARIKILSNMRLDEKRKPQDGRFSAKIDGRKIDFRVSTFPTYYGEKIVMRILDPEKGVKKLDDIGLSKQNLELIREAIREPYGLILISGPTGSGKTTTLYSMLSEVDKDKKNVLSLEDPIEYNIEGVSQSQVRQDIGYTFANGLRTTLRQDPDIIMVGEIRDAETAQLAIQAALTGHLVFSTIHTNNAIGVVPRLIDMGVDPYLIAPTLRLAIAQRLVSRLCEGEAEPLPVEDTIKTMLDKEFADLPEQYKKDIHYPTEVYNIKPSPNCPSGTSGRVAVMEVVKITHELERVILKNPNEQDIYKAARKNGMITMKEDAILKSFRKEIPFAEISTL